MINLKTNLYLKDIDIESYIKKYPNINNLEIAILQLKKENCSYPQIQKLVGNPSRKFIRETILKYEPSLLEDNNSSQKSNITPKKRIIGLIQKFNKFDFDLDEFDESTFSIQGDKLYWKDWKGEVWDFDEFDERTQLSILYNIARILNINIKSNEFKPEQSGLNCLN